MDRLNNISGVVLTPLKIIPGSYGAVYHGLKSSESSFSTFGEAYFSTVTHNAVKGWKQHTLMQANLVVPVGAIRFVLFDSRPDSPTLGAIMDVVLSQENYQRLTIPPGIWLAFQGIGQELNMLLNIASIAHDPLECQILPLETDQIPFVSW